MRHKSRVHTAEVYDLPYEPHGATWNSQPEHRGVHLDIPESVASSRRLPVPKVEPRLRTELGIAVIALPFGKDCELAGSFQIYLRRNG